MDTSMPMSSDEIVNCMARDFSEYLGEILEIDDAPADDYFDPIATVFGDNPTQETVLQIYRSENGPANLASELNSWLETDVVTFDMAKNLLELTITNNFGADAIE